MSNDLETIIREESEDNTDLDDEGLFGSFALEEPKGTTVSRLKDRWEQMSVGEGGKSFCENKYVHYWLTNN